MHQGACIHTTFRGPQDLNTFHGVEDQANDKMLLSGGALAAHYDGGLRM